MPSPRAIVASAPQHPLVCPPLPAGRARAAVRRLIRRLLKSRRGIGVALALSPDQFVWKEGFLVTVEVLFVLIHIHGTGAIVGRCISTFVVVVGEIKGRKFIRQKVGIGEPYALSVRQTPV